MTIAVAVRRNKKIFIGADTLEVYGDHKNYGTKIVKIKDCYVSGSGMSNSQSIIEGLVKSADWVESFKMESVQDAKAFSNEIWAALKEEVKLWPAGAKNEDDGGEELLIVTPTKIFKTSRMGYVTEIKDYACIGSGSSYGYGNLHRSSAATISGKVMVELALEAACYFDNNCGGEFEVFEV